MIPVLKGLLTGMAFGVVLYKVGASRFSRVIGMVTLRDTKVMKFAFTAIATASTFYGLAAVFGVAEQWNLVPRVMPYLGSAHLLGGVIFGVAMGATGTCPGTCVAKAGGRGGGVKFGPAASIFGLVAGILVYAALKPSLSSSGIVPEVQKPITLHGLLGLPYGAVALGWGALFFVIANVVDRLTPEAKYPPAKERKSVIDYVRGEWSWVASGLVGGTIIVLATMQNGYLGFSGAVLALVGSVAQLIGHPMDLVPKITDDILWRAALIVGVFPGGVLAHAISIPSAAAVNTPLPKVFDPRALGVSFAGGAGLALGAMIGGGCTTGAFISAFPTLSVGSMAMGMTFFAVSAATSSLLLATRRLEWSKLTALGDRAYD